jgi:hypothetical protein
VKYFDLHLVQVFGEVMDLALRGHADTVNPFEQLEAPPQVGPPRRLREVLRYRVTVLRSLGMQALCPTAPPPPAS